MNFLPKELEDIIIEYKNQLEHTEKYKLTLNTINNLEIFTKSTNYDLRYYQNEGNEYKVNQTMKEKLTCIYKITDKNKFSVQTKYGLRVTQTKYVELVNYTTDYKHTSKYCTEKKQFERNLENGLRFYEDINRNNDYINYSIKYYSDFS